MVDTTVQLFKMNLWTLLKEFLRSIFNMRRGGCLIHDSDPIVKSNAEFVLKKIGVL